MRISLKFVGGILVSLFLAACSNDGAGNNNDAKGVPGEAPALPVSAAKPLVRDVTDWDEYTGRFEAVQSVDVRARVSGYLQSIHFSDGHFVTAGDLLFVIDPRPFEAALVEARSDVERAAARLKYTETEVGRAEPLVAQGNISKVQYDLRVQERNQARAELSGAEARVRQAELDLEFTEVRAPISGRVSNYFVSEGNLISGGSSDATILTRIVSLDPIHFVFDAGEDAYLRYLRLHETGERLSSRETGNPVEVRLSDEEAYNHKGVMNFVDNRIDPETGTMRGRAVFDNPDHFLTPGLFGRLRLLGRGPYKAMLVPDSAILSDQTRRIVMVVGEGSAVTPKNVKTGRLYKGLRIIEEGLKADDLVILDGLMAAFPGSKVAPEIKTIELGKE